MSDQIEAVLRVRTYLTPEESAFIEDAPIRQALTMAEQLRRRHGGTDSDVAKFAAGIAVAALRKIEGPVLE